MSCAFSREDLALYIEGDLSAAAAQIAASHVARCADCRTFLEQLRVGQALLKSLRHETVSSSECTSMRREVMSIITDRRGRPGWAIRTERTIVLGVRRRSYALAACALLAIASVSLLSQVRDAVPDTGQSVAVFEGKDALVRPEGYRDWISVGSQAGPYCPGLGDGAADATVPGKSVYINPSGYQGYVNTGQFPEGTLMVWESGGRGSEAVDRPHHRSSVLLAAAKDSTRFAGGWGFFDFSGSAGRAPSRARALPEASGCRACHQQDAETDHVFTQFYPVLRSARHATLIAPPGRTADLTALAALSRPSRLFPSPVLART